MNKRYEIKETVAAPGWVQSQMTIYIQELRDEKPYSMHGPFMLKDQADRYKEWLEKDDVKKLPILARFEEIKEAVRRV